MLSGTSHRIGKINVWTQKSKIVATDSNANNFYLASKESNTKNALIRANPKVLTMWVVLRRHAVT